VVKIQIEAFWVVIPCNAGVGYCFYLQDEVHPEAGGSKAHQNIGILPRHHITSQPRRPQISHSWLFFI
jgi:hypothetical protein